MSSYPGEADGHDIDIDYEDCADEPGEVSNMTRKDELKQRALQFLQDEHAELSDLVALLQQVEREVLAHCQDKIESLMEKENESTDDQVWEYRDWLKDQQKELG